MEKAFWDCVEAELREDPPSYNHAMKLLSEIKESLLSLLLPHLHARLRTCIEEVLDLPLIQQQAENHVLDVGQLANFIVGMMATLDHQYAKVRDGEIQKLRETTEMVPLFSAIFSVLILMKMDMANFSWSIDEYHELLAKQPSAYTEKWLQDTVSEVFADSAITAMLPDNVHNTAYLRLLKWDHGSDPFPETVLMDQVRFQEMQWELERLVLLASVLLNVYTITGAAISGLPGLMDTLKTTVAPMLVDMHTPSFSAEEALATIGERLCVELSRQLDQHGYSPFSTDRRSTLKGQISATAQPDHHVRKLMDSRTQRYLLAYLESSGTETAYPVHGGLATVGKELTHLAIRFNRLVKFNKVGWSPVYQRILQGILQEKEEKD